MQIDFRATFDEVNHQGILYKLCSVGTGGYTYVVYIDSFYKINHSTLLWMFVEAKWLTLVRSAAGQYFLPVIVPPVYLGAVFHSEG